MTVKERGVFPAKLLLSIAIAALVGAIYGRGLAFPLVRDDDAHQLTRPVDAAGKSGRWNRSPAELGRHFSEEFWARGSQSGLYRPLTATTIQVTEWVAGLKPSVLKLGNALLLVATALAAAALARRLGLSRGAASLLALLIAAHPLLSEPVLEVVSRSETQALLGVLLAAWCIVGPASSRATAGAGGWYLFALLSKEGAFAAAPALVLLCLQGGPSLAAAARSRRGELLAISGALVVALALRMRVFGDPVGLDPLDISRLDNPLVNAPFVPRLLTGVATLGRYVATFLWPARLSVDWSFAAIVPIERWSDARADASFLVGAAALVAALAWLGVACRRGPIRAPRAELFGLLLAGASWWLVSSIARPIGTIYAERLFAASVVGLLLALVALLDRKLRSPAARRLAAGVGVAAVAALAARGFVRVGDWRGPDGLALYEAASRVAPNSARTECTLGHLLRERGDVVQAKAHVERALNILPDYGKAHTEMALCYHGSKAEGSALVHLWLAKTAPGASGDDRENFERGVQRYGGDPAVLAEFKRRGEELVARRPDVPLYLELGRELLRMQRR